LAAEVEALLKVSDGKQKGGPKKVARRIFYLVKSEWMAAGRPMQKRLLLGNNSLKTIREKCIKTLSLCAEWEEVIVCTDIVIEMMSRSKFQIATASNYHLMEVLLL
jgi:hypothetical protein